MRATGNFENARHVDPMVVLSDATRAHIDHWLTKFPPDRKRSAVLQGLHAAQEQNGGWLTDELIAAVAKYIGIPPVWAYEVASFYSMFALEPVGRNVVAVCTNISCWLNGAEDIVRHCEKKLGIKMGETTPDGMFTLHGVECLNACDRAPLIQVGDEYHGPMDEAKIDALIEPRAATRALFEQFVDFGERFTKLRIGAAEVEIEEVGDMRIVSAPAEQVEAVQASAG